MLSKMVRRCLSLLICATIAAALTGGAATSARADQQTLVWDLTSKYINKQDAITQLDLRGILSSGPTGLRTWVVVPDGYTPTRCWPVLYLLHGSQAPAEWAHVAPLVRGLPAIVVAPGGGDGVYTNWWNNGQRSPRWEDWFWDELMPKVQQSFNICPQRSDHAIAGTSMGGYGALYLASQRPDYFGTAGSFSGIIALSSPLLQIGFGLFPPVWGPANGFYANGHDPVVLARNLRHTRVLVEQGNGTPVNAADTDPSVLTGVEVSTQAMGRKFLQAARAVGVPVSYDLHAGIHTPPNFDMSLTRMLGWGAFGAVDERPATWTFRTVATHGNAWGFRFAFTRPPETVEQLSYSARTLRVQGTGRVTITTPAGRRVTATLPFAFRDGKARPLARETVFDNGISAKLPVPVGLTPWHPRLGQPVLVRFKTDRVLARGESYFVVERQQLPGCYTTVYAFVRQPRKGKIVHVLLKPGVARGHPDNRWCTGNGHVSLLVGSGTGLNNARIKYLGTATFNAAAGRP